MSKKRTITPGDVLSFYGAQPFIRLLQLLPHRAVLEFARAFGSIAYHIIPVRKGVVLHNVRRAFGDEKSDKEIHRIAKRCYQSYCMSFAEIIRMPRLTPEDIAASIESIEGNEYFEQLKALPSGCIVVSAHLGNWEMVVTHFSLSGLDISVVARPMHNALWDEAINSIREQNGLQVLSTRESPKHILAHVRRGRLLAFLVDQDARKRGVFVDFFGHPASTFAGPAVFMQRFNLPIFALFTVRTALDKHKVIFKPPLFPREVDGVYPTDDDTIRDIVEDYTNIVESIIREYPEQYFWFHRRWKTKPKRSG